MMHSPPALSPEDQEQILQTIEMFEVIVMASPHDTQSLEILKEAYVRVGRLPEALQIGRKLAELFVESNQFSSAVLEYETILQVQPSNVEVIAALGEVEEKMRQAGQSRETVARPAPMVVDLDAPPVIGGALMATAQTFQINNVEFAGGGMSDPLAARITEDGNESLAKFLILHKIVPEGVVRKALARVTELNAVLLPNTIAASLLDQIVQSGGVELESMLAAVIDRSKFSYIPLEYYEVDRQIVKMLPESLTLARLMVPFDLMSRTVMVATANPFDAHGKQAVQQLLDYNVQWHLASPAAIHKVLSDTYKVTATEFVENPPRIASSNAPVSPSAPPRPHEGPDTSSFKLASS